MKTLCDWSEKDIAKKLDELNAIVSDPRYVCRRCARAAGRKAALCKPKKLPTESDAQAG